MRAYIKHNTTRRAFFLDVYRTSSRITGESSAMPSRRERFGGFGVSSSPSAKVLTIAVRTIKGCQLFKETLTDY